MRQRGSNKLVETLHNRGRSAAQRADGPHRECKKMTYASLRSATTILAALTLGLSACGPAAPPPATSAPAAATTAPAAAAKPTTAPAAAATTAPAAAATTAPAAAATTAPAAAAKPTTAPAAAAAAPATLPADAAPPDQQVYVQAYDSTADFTTLDFWQSVYGRAGATSDLMTEPLVRLNKNFEIVPRPPTSGASTRPTWCGRSTSIPI